MKYSLLFLFAFSVYSCQQSTESKDPDHWNNIPEVMRTALDKNGGLENWSAMNTLEFSFLKGEKKEFHQIDLPSRKVRISHPDYTIGFDGNEVWVSPDKAAYGTSSARFYHNLIFYFYACPWVLADPGTNYEVLPQREMDGRTLIPVKVSFNDGVGDAPDDYYIPHFDAETGEMYLLLYTVTYFSGNSNENYGAIVFDDWEKFNGINLPKAMKGYRYAADTLGAQRYTRNFNDIKLETTALDASLFETPEVYEIDSLISN